MIYAFPFVVASLPFQMYALACLCVRAERLVKAWRQRPRPLPPGVFCDPYLP